MQGDAEAKPFDGIADRILQVGNAGAGFVGGFEDARADLLLVADIFVDRENREQPVPMYLSTSPPCFLIAVTWQSK